MAPTRWTITNETHKHYSIKNRVGMQNMYECSNDVSVVITENAVLRSGLYYIH